MISTQIRLQKDVMFRIVIAISVLKPFLFFNRWMFNRYSSEHSSDHALKVIKTQLIVFTVVCTAADGGEERGTRER